MSTTHTLKKGDFIRDGRGATLISVCTTGTESSLGGQNPTNSASGDDGKQYPADALPLGGASAVDILVEAYANGTFHAGGKLEAWVFNQYQRIWCRCPDLDLNVQEGLGRQMFVPRKIDSRLGWLAYLPEGLGVGCTITLTVMPVRI